MSDEDAKKLVASIENFILATVAARTAGATGHASKAEQVKTTKEALMATLKVVL